MQQRFAGARRRQGEEQAVLVLFALGGPRAQRAHDGGRWGCGAGGGGPRRSTPGLGEAIRATRQEQPHGLRAACRRRGPGPLAGTRDRRNSVFTIPPRPGEVFRHVLGGRLLSRGHDKARLVPRDHDCGCDAPPPRLGPGGGGIRAGLIAARERSAAGTGGGRPA